MLDPLLNRARLAIEENWSLRDHRRSLMEQQKAELAMLRVALLEGAMTRVEIKALREDKQSMDESNIPGPPAPPRCPRCGSVPRAVQTLLNPRTGKRVRIYRCQCEEPIWDD